MRASDGTMHTDHMVMVTVTEDDEAPTVMGKDSVNYPENGEDAVATFTATDPEGVTPITWSVPTDLVAGNIDDIEDADDADNASFDIDKDGMLKFNSPPDYEASTDGDGGGDADNDNTYHVVVVAADVADNRGYHKVTVKVTNVAEKGKVTWTIDPSTETDVNANNPDNDEMPIMQFQDGAVLVASATDGDVAGDTKTVTDDVTWRWYRGGTLIGDATVPTYTVKTEDVTKRLRVMVGYTVDEGREESASLTSDYPVLRSRSSNDVPEFSPATVTREVSEGDKGMTVGAPVRATDDITNALNYTLGGVDATRFEIDQKTGQIKTLVDLDREGTDEANATTLGSCDDANGTDPDPECTVTVTATDSAGEASDPMATVTIKITNVDEKPKFSTADPATGMKMISRDEGMTALAETGDVANVTYAATDPDGLQVNLTLRGDDGAKFQLTSSTGGGVLSFKEKPDYEKPTDGNKDNVYEVTVRASDGTMHTDHMVMVTVTDLDEAPEIIGGGLTISGSSSKDFVEGETDAVGMFTARGPMKDMARWTLEGADRMYFRVGTARGAMTELMFKSAPDYEMPRGRAMSDTNTNTYMVTLKADDGTYMDTHDVTVMVTNMKEDGTVMLSSMTPVVGVELTASLTDSDGGVMDVTWVWETSSDMSTWAAGGGTAATSMDMMKSTYTPVMADDGMYLRATATYTDDYGNDMAMAATTAAVTAGDPLVIRYDTNPENGMIDKSEVIAAINEYLDAGADAPSKADVIRLINLYLDG